MNVEQALPIRVEASSEFVLVQRGHNFHCSAIVYQPASVSPMTDLHPAGTDLKPVSTPAFITATTDRPINTMAPIHLAVGDRRLPLAFLRSHSGKVITDRIRIDEPDATRAATLWNLP